MARKIQVFKVITAVNDQNYNQKKSIHTSHVVNDQNQDGKSGRDDGDEYELDLITLTRRKKQKKQPPTVPESESQVDRAKDTVDSSNARYDDYSFKKIKEKTPFLDSEDVRYDNGLIDISPRDLKKVKARKKYRTENPTPVRPLFESSKRDGIASKLSKEEVNKFNQDIKDNLTRYLNEEYDRVYSKNKKLKPSDLYEIISTATARAKEKGSSKNGLENKQTDEKNIKKDENTLTSSLKSQSEDVPVSSPAGQVKETIEDMIKDSKSDNDLVSGVVIDKDSKSDDELVPKDSTAFGTALAADVKSDDDLISTSTGLTSETTDKTDTKRNIQTKSSFSNSEAAEEILDNHKSRFEKEPRANVKIKTKPNDEDVANISMPKVKEPSASAFKYNTEYPEIDQLNNIINVTRPIVPSKSQLRRIKKRNKAVMSELTDLSHHEKINKIDDIMKILENEIPKLSKERLFTSESEVNATSDRIKYLRENFEKVQKAGSVEPQNGDEVDISLKDLEGFLENAKKKQVSRVEEQFREERAYEISRILNDKNARTLDKKNLFTPVDSSLANTVPPSLRFRPKADEGPVPDDLFFPSIKPQKNLSHEFMVLSKNKTIITEGNPLGDDHIPQDLFTIFRNLGNPENYLKQITKFEKNGGWKLIGSGGDTNKILIFERFVDKEQEKKDIRKRRFRRFAWTFTTVFVLLYGFGSYFEHQQKAQYKIDENGKVVKSK